MIIRITYKDLCFGMIASNTPPAFIIDAPPVAKWAIGGDCEHVLAYWMSRGAKVEVEKEYADFSYFQKPPK